MMLFGVEFSLRPKCKFQETYRNYELKFALKRIQFPGLVGSRNLLKFISILLDCKSPFFELVKIWVFPKIMVPPNDPVLIGFSIINHPFWGPTSILETSISSETTLQALNTQEQLLSEFQMSRGGAQLRFHFFWAWEKTGTTHVFWANYNDLFRRLGIPPNGGEK